MNVSFRMTLMNMGLRLESNLQYHGPRLMGGYTHPVTEERRVLAIMAALAIFKGVTGEMTPEQWQPVVANYIPEYIPDHLLEYNLPWQAKLTGKIEELIIDPIWMEWFNMHKSDNVSFSSDNNVTATPWASTTVVVPGYDGLTGKPWTYRSVNAFCRVMNEEDLEGSGLSMSDAVVLLDNKIAKERKRRFTNISSLLKHGHDVSCLVETPKIHRLLPANPLSVNKSTRKHEEREVIYLAVELGNRLLMGPVLPGQGIPVDLGDIEEFKRKHPYWRTVTRCVSVVKIESD